MKFFGVFFLFLANLLFFVFHDLPYFRFSILFYVSQFFYLFSYFYDFRNFLEFPLIFQFFFSGIIVANVSKERPRVKKFTGKEPFRFLSLMAKISSCIVKICAYWQNYFWITKRCTLMWSLSYFISFVKWINREHISSDIFQKKKNHQKVIFSIL